MEIMGFRSTGSYEPDPFSDGFSKKVARFDPQALTSLTKDGFPRLQVIDGFDPQALTSLTSKNSWF